MRAADGPVPQQLSAQARATVETLTGMAYENLWGNNNIGYLNRNKPPAAMLPQAPTFPAIRPQEHHDDSLPG